MSAAESTDGYLFDLYRRYIGEPEDRTDVYVGFGLFLGGVGFAVVALLLFLWSTTFEARSAEYFAWVEPAYMIAMVSVPVALLGVVVLLPSERRMLYTSIAGVAITVGAVVGFYVAYPENWLYGENYTVEIVATYAVGLAGVAASTGAALIAHYLDMAQTVDRLEQEVEETESATYTDEEIQQDIDDAMADVELSWGGVEKNDNTRLTFSDHEFDDVEVDTDAGTTTTRSTGIDSQVASLKGLKSGESKTTTSSATVDEQTEKLRELREQKRAEDEAATGETDVKARLTSIVDRLRAILGSG
ncbi:DUF7139 domain-containing protein [Natronobacterium gregoryi]|uniref:Permease n=2 Tax=Natronobacterium gregoryi TaxID=44930 RepID=L0ADT8_NATGS|nr:hypothetical protein [Natronobacterium gregoryi]AFZ71307.1 hypothetical protein Natgr_0036 [Natronobacterium gregoryi SP2]ELY67196.1 hypothetical protein C490_11341 [Natronobacterium gregoryi SP2]PLK19179.1 permease [Natronobacterium gregoryi SP2]SFJ58836.1 hypothetical protein SAMN05443661_1439 [Natronobacterium gregoryi]